MNQIQHNAHSEDRGQLLTEMSNDKSADLDRKSVSELVGIFNVEDLEPQRAVARCIPEIAEAIELIISRLKSGGRLFYLGAGTSGRLGVLDASECPPTFCTPPELVQGVIAGGDSSLRNSSEGLEDSSKLSIEDLKFRELSNKDCLIGITACGTTTYVNSGLSYAKELGALTISIACVPLDQVKIPSDLNIRLLTGPELLTGSTRLKAGTATKMTLNMISTIVMIKLGKVFKNKMVDVSITNNKLTSRAIRIIKELTGLNSSEAEKYLMDSDGSVKRTLLMALGSVDASQAKKILKDNDDNLRDSLEQLSINV